MLHRIRYVLLPFLLLFVITATGLPSTFGTPPSENNLTKAYTSEMCFNVDLTDPETGQPMHPAIETINPVVQREIHRMTNEPLMRQVINQPRVQATQWFKQFNDSLDDALIDLQASITAEQVEGTALIRTTCHAADRGEAQLILTEWNEQYMRLAQLRDAAARQKDLRAAQRRMQSAEERVTSITGAIKRHMAIAEQDDPAEQTQPAFERESLMRRLGDAEEQLGIAQLRIADLIELQDREISPLGYRVLVEYPPQKERETATE